MDKNREGQTDPQVDPGTEEGGSMDDEVILEKLTDLKIQINTIDTKVEDIKSHTQEDYSCRVDIKKELARLSEQIAVFSATCVRKEDLTDIQKDLITHGTLFKIFGAVLVFLGGAVTAIAAKWLP